ncbi:hypothetical protein MRBLMR1_000666 [Neorhizobium sp. LMR1-1-1.1]|jgi:hypothetical protein
MLRASLRLREPAAMKKMSLPLKWAVFDKPSCLDLLNKQAEFEDRLPPPELRRVRQRLSGLTACGVVQSYLITISAGGNHRNDVKCSNWIK